MARKRIAKDDVHIGRDGVVPAGDEIPASYTDINGDEQKVDFDRLEELGLLGEPEQDSADAPVDISKLKKDELLAVAAAEGVEVDSSATKPDIIAAIQASRA